MKPWTFPGLNRYMYPTDFPQTTACFAKEQKEYLPLPAFVDPKDPTGTVITLWRGSYWERLTFLWTGKMWMRTLTFCTPLQPMRPQMQSPFPPLAQE